MNILAIDTAGKTAAVAVMRDDTLLYEMASNTGLTHSETLLPMVDTALKACGLTPAQLDLYAVTNGPGSFTGLRIGLAAVKGLAFAANTPCAGVSTMAALAYGVCGEGTAQTDPLRGRLHDGRTGLRPFGRRHRHRRTGRPPRPGVLGRV